MSHRDFQDLVRDINQTARIFNSKKCERIIRAVFAELEIIIEPPENVPYSAKQAFEKIKPGTNLLLKTTQDSTIVKELNFYEGDQVPAWVVTLSVFGQRSPFGLLADFVHEDGSICGTIKQ